MNFQLLAETIADGVREVYSHPESRNSMTYTGGPKFSYTHLSVKEMANSELEIVIHEPWSSGFLRMPIGD